MGGRGLAPLSPESNRSEAGVGVHRSLYASRRPHIATPLGVCRELCTGRPGWAAVRSSSRRSGRVAGLALSTIPGSFAETTCFNVQVVIEPGIVLIAWADRGPADCDGGGDDLALAGPELRQALALRLGWTIQPFDSSGRGRQRAQISVYGERPHLATPRAVCRELCTQHRGEVVGRISPRRSGRVAR